MSRQDQDSFTEPSFVPRSVAPQKFETPDEYLNFLKENELTDLKTKSTSRIASEITQKLKILAAGKPSIPNQIDVSRTVYVWNFDVNSLDSVSNYPKIWTRSKTLVSDYAQKKEIDHSIAIQLISQKKKTDQNKLGIKNTVVQQSVDDDEE